MLRPGARIVGGLGCLVVITSLAGTAAAAPRAADLTISIGASTGLSTTGPTLTPNGGTATDSDPDAANNAVSITIVVTESAGGAGGGGGGGGASAAVTASAVKVSPAQPKAGSTAVASVRVTQGGSPLRPTRITCAASIGKIKLKGASRASSGVASCLFRMPTNAKGKALRGSVSFRAGGSSFTKRFAVRLG